MGKCRKGSDEAAVVVKNGEDDSRDAEEHDDALNQVIYNSCHVSAQDNIDTGKSCHDDYADLVVDVEGHIEES